ncbi:nitrite/sulfite reductase [Ectothiorhodospiraceae bacterium WFHF3C12]|nr:nitrite/sulfite reductase [Ectothiorhodospiraceae bacterium WFHF3C12]
MSSWKQELADVMPAELSREIDIFENQIDLKKQGKVEDKLFAETRLRRGVYGQRYDNAQRHDGVAHRELAYPSTGNLFKGPDTVWDAPGMMRIKIPYGGLSAAQLELLADVAEEYSDAILHVTTRQDIQLHYVHIDDTPDLMRRLAAVGITTREACGNSVRNVTACPKAGCCKTEQFDVTPYADALTRFLLGHPDVQDFGRKFKVAFSGCAQEACGLTNIHDLGFLARTRTGADGNVERGFEIQVGGGLGAVPHYAKVLYAFAGEDEILPISQAISRVFAKHGEKKNRGKARMKFLVAKWGIEAFREEVEKERANLPEDPRWTDYIDSLDQYGEVPAREPKKAEARRFDPNELAWESTNVVEQKQDGYSIATVTLPLGDLTSTQTRQLADLARKYVGDNIRTTVEQNMVLRWVPDADLPELFNELQAIGLGSPGAGTIQDIVACPGTDTCKLGIANSRGLAAELHERLAVKYQHLDEAIQGLHIKISGCFNSCGQHHVSDLGFYGVSRKVQGTTVPHFRVVLGGQWEDNGGAYGLTIGAVPSKRVPDFVDALTDRYLAEREGKEGFQAFVQRIGKRELKKVVDEFATVPDYNEDATLFSDWRDPREFTISDIGVGECAGEVVTRVEFDLQEAERLYFEAQLYYDEGQPQKADDTAYAAMVEAARALVRVEDENIGNDPDTIVDEFRTRFYDTGLFQDRYAGGKFASYLFNRHAEAGSREYSEEFARYLLEETQLFIEAAHACHGKLLEQRQQQAAVPSIPKIKPPRRPAAKA